MKIYPLFFPAYWGKAMGCFTSFTSFTSTVVIHSLSNWLSDQSPQLHSHLTTIPLCLENFQLFRKLFFPVNGGFPEYKKIQIKFGLQFLVLVWKVSVCSESFDCIWKLFNNSAKKIHFKSPVCLKNFQSIQQLFQSIRKPLALPDNLEFFQDLNHVFFLSS